MILYTDNQADNAIITSPELSIFNPPSNVKDPRLSKVYKGDKDISLNISGAGSAKNISQEYTNLVQDPTDLTTSNWDYSALGNQPELTTESINGHIFSLLKSDGVHYARYLRQNITLTNNCICSFICRRVNSDLTRFILYDFTDTTAKAEISIDWDNKTCTSTEGDLLKYTYIDDITVEVYITTVGVIPANDNAFLLYPTEEAAEESVMVTECQLVDDTTTMYPFTAGTHTADVITEAFTMPDRFTGRIKLKPNFMYDTTVSNPAIASWRIDGDNRILLYYEEAGDKLQLYWKNGGSGVYLQSNTFDNGTTYTNLNQELDIIFSLDLLSGGINDSRFIVIPQSTGLLYEDSTWSGPPDIKTSTFPTLSIGNENGLSQIDSSFEYLRIYEGLLTGDVSSSSDVDNLLKDKKILLDKTYQQKIKATDLLIAGSTINDGDKIILQGNNVDSWGTGTPLYESVVWSKDIIKHHFIESNYQFYRISVNSSNDIEIGRIYLGGRYATAGNHVTVPHDRKSASAKTISVSGQSYMDGRYKYSLVSTKWPILTETQNNEILEIFDTIDIGTPFFVTFDRAGSILGTMYVTIDEDGLKSTPLGNRNFYTMGMDFRQEV